MNQIQQIKVEKDQDMLFMSVGLYKMFLSHGEVGLEAMNLYQHLMFTARLQETNQVWANEEYLKHGLKIGERKLKMLKSFLSKKGLIEYVKDRGEDGLVKQVYIKVKFLASLPVVNQLDDQNVNQEDQSTSAEFAPVEETAKEEIIENLDTNISNMSQQPLVQESTRVVDRTGGSPHVRCQETNALNKKVNALIMKEKEQDPEPLSQKISKAKNHYSRLFEARFKTKPVWQEKWTDRIKQDLQTYEPDEWLKCVTLVFSDKIQAIKEFCVVKGAGFGYAVVSSQIPLVFQYTRESANASLPVYKPRPKERASPEELITIGLSDQNGNFSLSDALKNKIQEQNREAV